MNRTFSFQLADISAYSHVIKLDMGTTDETHTPDPWRSLGIEAAYVTADLARLRESRSWIEPGDLAIAGLVRQHAIRYERTREMTHALATFAAALVLLKAAGVASDMLAADHSAARGTT